MQILQDIADREQLQLVNYTCLAGGDINDVFKLNCANNNFVVKLNSSTKFPDMFKEEAFALNALADTETFQIPKVIAEGTIDTYAYLVLEYIAQGRETTIFWEEFALNLAQLHNCTSKKFGWASNNYIGSLLQHNSYCSSSTEFYITQRLQPQLKLAKNKGYKFKDISVFLKNLESCIPDNEVPALIHGDLWSGNFMVNTKGQPVLIDPAIGYASREMDIAMMNLFGGFPERVFQAYQEAYPLLENWQNRVELYQLYYLLVHLNIFGKSYFDSVQRIIKKHT